MNQNMNMKAENMKAENMWQKTEYVRTKMSCFLLAKLNVVSLC